MMFHHPWILVMQSSPQNKTLTQSIRTCLHPNLLTIAASLLPDRLPSTTFCLWNAHSLVNKIDNFQSFVYSNDFKIIAITETWLHDYIYNGEILPTGYTIYRKDGSSRGGGSCLE